MVGQALPAATPVRTPPHRPASHELENHWVGEVTCLQTPALRDQLMASLQTLGGAAIRLNVALVTKIDATGIALLIAANNRAAGVGRRFILVDSAGPVSQELMRLHLIQNFIITQVVSA